MSILLSPAEIYQVMLDKPIIKSPSVTGTYGLYVKKHTDPTFTLVKSSISESSLIYASSYVGTLTYDIDTLYDIKFIDSVNGNHTKISYLYTGTCYKTSSDPDFTYDTDGVVALFTKPADILPSDFELRLYAFDTVSSTGQLSDPIISDTFYNDEVSIILSTSSYRFYWVYLRLNSLTIDTSIDEDEAAPFIDWHTCYNDVYSSLTTTESDCLAPDNLEVIFSNVTRRRVKLVVPTLKTGVDYLSLEKRPYTEGVPDSAWAIEIERVPDDSVYVYSNNLIFGKEYRFRWVSQCCSDDDSLFLIGEDGDSLIEE